MFFLNVGRMRFQSRLFHYIMSPYGQLNAGETTCESIKASCFEQCTHLIFISMQS